MTVHDTAPPRPAAPDRHAERHPSDPYPEPEDPSRDARAPRDPAAAIATLRAEAHLFYLDGSGVLFSERVQALHLLNPTAALVYSLVQEGHDAHSAALALQDLQGLDAATGTHHVNEALAQWEAVSALPAHPHADASPVIKAMAPRRTLIPYPVAEEHHYRLLDTTFRVAFGKVEQARAVHPVLAHLETDAGGVDTTIDVVAAGARIVAYLNGEVAGSCASTDEITPIVKSLVWVTAVNRHDFLLDIHAGVVSNDAACLLLPAASGSGKSTLTAALVHEGYRLYSDEVALLADGTFEVFPVPLAIGIKSSGIEALADRFPCLRNQPQHLRADGKRVAYLSPPPASLPATNRPCPVTALVFPRYAPDATTELVRLPAFEALQRLIDECLVLRKRLDFDRVERLVTWIGSIPAYRLDFVSTDAAVALVTRVLPRPVSRAPVVG